MYPKLCAFEWFTLINVQKNIVLNQDNFKVHCCLKFKFNVNVAMAV